MNLAAIKSDINFLVGSTSATYLNSDKVRNINIAYHDVARTIWESEGGWQYDDGNNTDVPIATKSLGNASATYSIPTTALRIEGIEVKDANSNWAKLVPITYQDMTISPESFLTGNGLPIYYQLEGNVIRLFPSPTSAYATLASGLRVRLSRDITELGVSATTTTPGFPAAFHRILSYAAAIDFTQDPQQRQFFVQQKERLMQGMVRFYSKRGEEFKTRILPSGKKRWRKYV